MQRRWSRKRARVICGRDRKMASGRGQSFATSFNYQMHVHKWVLQWQEGRRQPLPPPSPISRPTSRLSESFSPTQVRGKKKTRNFPFLCTRTNRLGTRNGNGNAKLSLTICLSGTCNGFSNCLTNRFPTLLWCMTLTHSTPPHSAIISCHRIAHVFAGHDNLSPNVLAPCVLQRHKVLISPT